MRHWLMKNPMVDTSVFKEINDWSLEVEITLKKIHFTRKF